MELKLRKHIKNIHANKNTPSEMSKTAKHDKKDDENEMIVDEGQGFTDAFVVGPWILHFLIDVFHRAISS